MTDARVAERAARDGDDVVRRHARRLVDEQQRRQSRVVLTGGVCAARPSICASSVSMRAARAMLSSGLNDDLRREAQAQRAADARAQVRWRRSRAPRTSRLARPPSH